MDNKPYQGLSLVLGGARSGKSKFAEKLCLYSGKALLYIATCQIYDQEMDARIKSHQSRRSDEWKLLEEPLNLSKAIASHANDQTCILVDCLTLWLSNLMMAEKDVNKECQVLLNTLQKLPKSHKIIFVSNEVGQGIVPMDKMARDFRDFSGQLHQELAAIAQNVWFITAGLSQQLK